MRSNRVAILRLVLVFLACCTVSPVYADDPQHLSGSWVMTITANEPPGLPPFKGLITFTRNGEVVESRRPYVPATPFGPILETSGHGAWVRTEDHTFAVEADHPPGP